MTDEDWMRLRAELENGVAGGAGFISPTDSQVEDVLNGLRRLVTESRHNLALVPNGTDSGDLWDVVNLDDLMEYGYDSALMGRGESPAEALCDAWRKV